MAVKKAKRAATQKMTVYEVHPDPYTDSGTLVCDSVREAAAAIESGIEGLYDGQACEFTIHRKTMSQRAYARLPESGD